MGLTRIVISAMLLLAGQGPINAQTVSGGISGSVIDPSGTVIVGANVELISDLSAQVRSFLTDSRGNFIFTDVVPGGYSVKVSHPGFRTYTQTGIYLSGQEHLSLHELKLVVGDVNTSVQVTADAAHVATESSAHEVTISVDQVKDTPTAGRNYLDLLRLLPGTAITTSNDTRGSTVPKSGAQSGVDGSPGQMLMTLDGVAQQDNGNPRTGGFLAPSVDAIGEVQVLVSNYDAAYGSRSGGQLNVTIKNGTNQFHGSAYWFMRHEMFNANEFFNNKNGVQKARYRYQNPGLTFGGPLLIPGTRFNRSRTKLFFFFSEDYLHNVSVPTSFSQLTLPTAAERSGDFSQSRNSAGALITLKDPTTGTPVPGNILPASRITPIGTAMMSLFPMPFTTDPSGQRQFNAVYQYLTYNPREDRILRVDYNLDAKTNLYVRLINDYQNQRAMTGALHLSGAWGQGYTDYAAPSAGAVLTMIHTFRPNLLNEFTWGINRFDEQLSPSDPASFASLNQLPLKDANGNSLALPSLFLGANVLNLKPQISFATSGAQSANTGIANPPTFGFDARWPFFGADTMTNLTNNVTWIKGAHTTKFGFYWEQASRDTAITGTAAGAEGQFFFGSDAADPSDTGYGFANLLAGSVQAYGADNRKLTLHGRYKQFEWFMQDNWKLSRRLTLDLGIRFQSLGPITGKGATLGAFSPGSYSSSQAGQLLFPACTTTVSGTGTCPTANRVAIDPASGATFAFARASSFDPNSYPAGGTPFSGITQYQESYWHNPGIAIGPRIGFAWDVLGDGKLAVRGGFGFFYDRAFASGVESMGFILGVPPYFQSPTFYNTTFGSLATTTGYLGPQTVYSGNRDYLNPTVYNFSIGVQRALGKGIILDASFLGNIAHHGFGGGGAGSTAAIDLNPVAPLTDWLPTPTAGTTANGLVKTYLDPTSAGGGAGAFYAASLIRGMVGYRGYGAINAFNNIGESYYDSLQVQVNKRIGKTIRFGSNWTWAKQITYSHQQWVPDLLTKNVAGRPHAVNLSFGYMLPKGSRLWKNPFTAAVLDGWNFSGVGAFFMGTPLTIGCSYVAAAGTGTLLGWPNGTPTGGIPQRCQMTGNLFLPNGASAPVVNTATGQQADPRLWYPFNPSSFTAPPLASLGLGNTPPTLTYGPGFENLDLSFYKDFQIGKRESRTLGFRADMFNALNHFNPGNPATSLTIPINASTYAAGAYTNANTFGIISTAQNVARRMSLSLRFRF